MTPTWEAEGIQLYLGDCLEILPTLEVGSVDAVIADYPFGFSQNTWDCDAEQVNRLTTDSLAYFRHILSESGSAFVMFGFSTVAQAAVQAKVLGFHLVNWIIWRFDTGYHPTTRFKNRAYHILWLAGDSWTFNGDEVRIPHRTEDKRNNPNGAIPSDVWIDIIEVKKNSYDYTGHRGQKPAKLLDRLIKATTNPSATILDPFMGSGTTGAACVKMGRNFIGIEIDPDYFEIAKNRIQEAMMQPRLEGLT